MNKLVKNTFVVGFALSVMPILVLAQARDARVENRTEKQAIRKDLKEEHRVLEDKIRKERETLRESVKGLPPKEALKKRLEVQVEMRKERQDFRADAKERIATFKEKAQERREELKKKIGEARANAVEKIFVRTLDRFADAIERLEKLADRIESRLNKLSSDGTDTSALQVLLEKARGSLGEARATLEIAQKKYDEMINSTEPKSSFEAVKLAIRDTKEKIKSAHKALVDVIVAIKPGQLKSTGNATSTTSVQ